MNKIYNLHFPVNILLRDSSRLFEYLSNAEELKYHFISGLSHKIRLVCDDREIHNSAECQRHFDEDNKEYFQITIWDNFCQYLWALCYTSLIVMDESIVKPLLKNNMPPNQAKLKISYYLFMDAMSLYNPDDTKRANRSVFFGYPNPVCHSEDEYVQAANTLFIACLCFVIFHEYQHFHLKHRQQDERKTDEYEADYMAFYAMYENVKPEIKEYTGLSIIVILGSLFFTDSTLDGETHPDPDDRLTRLLTLMNDMSPRGQAYCYGMAITIYKLWAFFYGYTDMIPDIRGGESPQEYFGCICQAINKFKMNRPPIKK